MTGARSYTTKIWRQPSSIGFSSADALSTSMDPPGEPVISTQKRPCQKIQNGSEFPELVAQNFRNPQQSLLLSSLDQYNRAGPHKRVLAHHGIGPERQPSDSFGIPLVMGGVARV